MVNGGIEISHPRILDKIRYHKFGVVVAVTNGIVSPERRVEVRKQIKTAKSVLEKAVGDAAQINSGLALVRNTEKDIADLDFLLQIPDYNPGMLLQVAEGVLENNSLQGADARYLSDLLRLSDLSGPDYLMGLLNQNRQLTSLGSRRKRTKYPYNNQNLARVKEVVLEQYVRSLFESVLHNAHAYALDVTMRDTEVRPDKSYHADLIIAADSTDFYRGVEALHKILPKQEPVSSRSYRGRAKLSCSHVHVSRS